jgi:hypothetical protein
VNKYNKLNEKSERKITANANIIDCATQTCSATSSMQEYEIRLLGTNQMGMLIENILCGRAVWR